MWISYIMGVCRFFLITSVVRQVSEREGRKDMLFNLITGGRCAWLFAGVEV